MISGIEYDMYPYAYKALRRRYPAYENWELYERPNMGYYIPDFVIDKKIKNKPIQRIVAEVKYDSKIRQQHVDQLYKYVQKLSGNHVRIKGRFLIVPAGIDASIMEDFKDIDLIILKAFKV